ncbi:MAG: cold shock domain-containing protein [Dehalococcoidales bacterium]|jgi:cold shock CspA family protein|nr:cold shock domain-containing protein [Dehalococcoidales bacterium]
MSKGTIKRLMDRGFGFIKSEDQEGDVSFHRNDLQGVQFNDLREGLEVEFEISMGRDNRQQAINVRPSQPEGESVPET